MLSHMEVNILAHQLFTRAQQVHLPSRRQLNLNRRLLVAQAWCNEIHLLNPSGLSNNRSLLCKPLWPPSRLHRSNSPERLRARLTWSCHSRREDRLHPRSRRMHSLICLSNRSAKWPSETSTTSASSLNKTSMTSSPSSNKHCSSKTHQRLKAWNPLTPSQALAA